MLQDSPGSALRTSGGQIVVSTQAPGHPGMMGKPTGVQLAARTMVPGGRTLSQEDLEQFGLSVEVSSANQMASQGTITSTGQNRSFMTNINQPVCQASQSRF